MKLEFEWMNAGREDLAWDYCEVDLETENGIWHLSPSVGAVEGVEKRWIYSIDVADPSNATGVRALIPPAFAATYEEAIAGAELAVRNLSQGVV